MASFSTAKRKMERDGTRASYTSNGIGSYLSNETSTIYMIPSHHKTGLSKAEVKTLIHTKKLNFNLLPKA